MDLRHLGAGLNGVVFRAKRRTPNRGIVAIKFIRVAPGDTLARKRLIIEVAAMKKLDGSHAIRLYDSDLASNPPYYVMEFLPLGDFRRALQRQWEPAPLLDLFLRICKAVEACHKAGITHRDLKPENILFRRRGMPILADFGICKFGTTALGTSAAEMHGKGTPLYMAPEQQRDDLPQSPPADVFALGTMLHFDIAEARLSPVRSSLRSRPLMRNALIRKRLVELAEDCTLPSPTRRPSLETLIESVKEVHQKAASWKAARENVRRIIASVDDVQKRVKKSPDDFLDAEARYLATRIEQFNELSEILTDIMPRPYDLPDWNKTDPRYQLSNRWSWRFAENVYERHQPKAEDKRPILAYESERFRRHARKSLRLYH